MKDLILTFVIFATPILVGYKYVSSMNPIRYGLMVGPAITAVLAIISMIMGDSFADAITRVSYTFPIFIGLSWAGATVYFMTRPEGERGEEKLKIHLLESLVLVIVMVLLFWYPLQDKFFGGSDDTGIYEQEKSAPTPLKKS